MTEFAYRYLEATVIAHKATGLPITTHTHFRQGVDQVEYFEQRGVDMDCVLIGHMGDTDDLGYITSVMDRCGFIGLDRFCIAKFYNNFISDEVKMNVVKNLIDRGNVSKLCLSHDVCCLIDNWEERRGLGNIWKEVKKFDLETHPFQFDSIDRFILPGLKKRGVTDEQIDTMMVENPRRFFETTGRYKY
jgi:phosphotriesterase-related protein